MKVHVLADPRVGSSQKPASGNAQAVAGAVGLSEPFALATRSPASRPSVFTLSRSQTEFAHEAEVQALREYLEKTPEQRMREAILKMMGLTEDDIQKHRSSEALTKQRSRKRSMKSCWIMRRERQRRSAGLAGASEHIEPSALACICVEAQVSPWPPTPN